MYEISTIRGRRRYNYEWMLVSLCSEEIGKAIRGAKDVVNPADHDGYMGVNPNELDRTREGG